MADNSEPFNDFIIVGNNLPGHTGGYPVQPTAPDAESGASSLNPSTATPAQQKHHKS
jgi:hypothetical protein